MSFKKNSKVAHSNPNAIADNSFNATFFELFSTELNNLRRIRKQNTVDKKAIAMVNVISITSILMYIIHIKKKNKKMSDRKIPAIFNNK